MYSPLMLVAQRHDEAVEAPARELGPERGEPFCRLLRGRRSRLAPRQNASAAALRAARPARPCRRRQGGPAAASSGLAALRRRRPAPAPPPRRWASPPRRRRALWPVRRALRSLRSVFAMAAFLPARRSPRQYQRGPGTQSYAVLKSQPVGAKGHEHKRFFCVTRRPERTTAPPGRRCLAKAGAIAAMGFALILAQIKSARPSRARLRSRRPVP